MCEKNERIQKLVLSYSLDELTAATNLKIKQMVPAQAQPTVVTVVDDIDVKQMPICAKAINCLQRAGIKQLSNLIRCSVPELMRFRGFGKKCLQDIQNMLGDLDYELSNIDRRRQINSIQRICEILLSKELLEKGEGYLGYKLIGFRQREDVNLPVSSRWYSSDWGCLYYQVYDGAVALIEESGIKNPKELLLEYELTP